MTTAEKLQNIGAEILEAIAAAYFRETKPDYANLIQTVINKRGKTRKDPLDGFLQLEVSGKDLFVLFEFTTEDKKGLEKKWLNDLSRYKRKPPKTAKEGDVIKAAKQADDIRTSFLDAVFYIVLCTNQEVSSSLAKKVSKKCKELRLKNDGIIDFSSLLHFLDNTPSGHWIRQKYLGINAVLLSPELFRWISKKNLNQYSQDIFYSLTPNVITRSIENLIIEMGHF